MKFLVDTNILIPLEPTSPADVEATTEPAVRFVRLISENAHQICVHPASLVDLSKDKDGDRRTLRVQLLKKYAELPHPPAIPDEVERIVGKALAGSNDYIDNLMLAALRADAVDWLVTQDVGLQRKAKRLGLSDRTLSLLDSIQVIEDLAAKPSSPPPVVEATLVHALDANDTIFETFRQDYADFDKWLVKCKRQQRQAWFVPGDSEGIAAFCIIKHESEPPAPLTGKVLKVCSFKVAERFQGLKYGELLLKTVFEYSCGNWFDWLFVTVFRKHDELLDLLRECGFQDVPSKTELGELILAKPMQVVAAETGQLDGLQRHVRYGPHYLEMAEGRTFLVPIQPGFARLLFPESAVQGDLFHGEHPFGSAIRKAYLCHSSIRTIEPGSVIVFYRSQQHQGLIAIGVVERAVVSKSWEEITRLVAKRTVYSLADIQELSKKDVLVILFRQALVLQPPISTKEAQDNAVFVKPPQSIMAISKKGAEWLRTKLKI